MTKFLRQCPTSMRSVAGYTLMQRARACDTNRTGGQNPEIEIWHYASDRLVRVERRWIDAIDWANAHRAIPWRVKQWPLPEHR